MSEYDVAVLLAMLGACILGYSLGVMRERRKWHRLCELAQHLGPRA